MDIRLFLEKAIKDYEEVYNSPLTNPTAFIVYLQNKNMHSGICRYCTHNFPIIKRKITTLINTYIVKGTPYWCDTPETVYHNSLKSTNEDIKEVIKIRLDNLKDYYETKFKGTLPGNVG